MSSQEQIHLSDFILERLAAGESRGLEEARKHLEECSHCQERLAQLQQEQAEWKLKAGPQKTRLLAQAREEQAISPLSPRARKVARFIGRSIGIGMAVATGWFIGIGPDAVRTKGDSSALQVLAKGQALEPGQAPANVPLAVRIACPKKGCKIRLFSGNETQPAELLTERYWMIGPGGPPLTLSSLKLELDESPQGEWIEAELCSFGPDPDCRRVRHQLR